MKPDAGKRAMNRLLCLFTALLLALPLAPAMAAVTHGMVTRDKVLFRKSPTTSDYWDRLDTGWVGKVLDETSVNGVKWFKVEANIPVNLAGSFVGYIHGDYFRMLSAAEETAWLVAKPQPFTGASATATPVAGPTATPGVAGSYALITAAGANLRQAPNGASITALAKDTLVRVLEGPTASLPWYHVETAAFTGYVHSDHLRVLSAAEKAAWDAAHPVPAPTPIPGSQASGMLETTLDSVNLRKTPGGLSVWKYLKGVRLQYYGQMVYYGGWSWAYVKDGAREGYIRSDCYKIVSGNATGATSAPTATPQPTGTQVRITLGGTNLRQVPGGTVLASLSRNQVLPAYSAPTASGGYDWVYVFDSVSGFFGYVRSDCYTFLTSATPTPTPGPVILPVGTLTLTKGGVNLRATPGGLTIATLDAGLVLGYTGFTQAYGYTWYQVNTKFGAGYVRSDVVRLNDSGATPAPTTPGGAGMMGYVITTKGGINMRATPGSEIIGRVEKGLVLALTGSIQTLGGFNWFPVVVSLRAGFLRSDCVRQLTQAEVTAFLEHGTVPGVTAPDGDTTPVATGYVKTTMTSVNIRKAPSQDAAVLGQIAAVGEAFPFVSTVTSGGKLWFKILYNAQEGYLLGTTARLMTAQEYADYIATRPTPTPAPSTPTPRPEDMSNTAITRMEKVLVRAAASATAKVLTTLYKTGTVAKLSGQVQAVSGTTWYKATAGGVTGWIRGDLLRILTKSEEQMLEDAGDPDAPPPASYRTLQLGSTGEDVTRLQQELSRLGYLQSAYVTGTYNSQTAEAVRAYQKAKGLFIDGIAGSATQHKLYNTVPEDTYNPGGGGSTVTPSLNPVELVDWYTGDINSFWGRGQVAIMTDVRTKISLRIKRWAGGSHVDGEPLTAADTAALCKVYGVSSAQEILEKNLYGRRPVWITIKGRTFAASLYGVPHNYPEGDTIAGNDFNGQLCIHFLNSRVHSSGAVDADHMKAIQDAYNAAPSKK